MTDTKPTADEITYCYASTWSDDFRIWIIPMEGPPWSDWADWHAAIADIKRKEAGRAQ